MTRPTFHNGTDTIDLLLRETDKYELAAWGSRLYQRNEKHGKDGLERVSGFIENIHVTVSLLHKYVLFSFSVSTLAYGHNLIPCPLGDLPSAFDEFHRRIGLDPHVLEVKRNDNTHNKYVPLPASTYTSAILSHPSLNDFRRRNDNVSISNGSGGLDDYDKVLQMKLCTGNEVSTIVTDAQTVYDELGRPNILRMSNRMSWPAMTRKGLLTGEHLLDSDVQAYFVLRHWKMRSRLLMAPAIVDSLMSIPFQDGREYALFLRYYGVHSLGMGTLIAKAERDVDNGLIQHPDRGEWVNQIRRNLRDCVNDSRILEWNQRSHTPDPILTFRTELNSEFRATMFELGHEVDDPMTYRIHSVEERTTMEDGGIDVDV